MNLYFEKLGKFVGQDAPPYDVDNEDEQENEEESEEELELSDSDKEGLPDLYEVRIGTDSNKIDTDGDGLTDYQEFYITKTDQTIYDSVKKGIADGEEYYIQSVDKGKISSDLFENNDAIPEKIVVEGKGNINKTIEISEYESCLKGDERDYVGKAIVIENADINGGEISFKIDTAYRVETYETVMGKTNGLIICYNNGEETTPLQTEYDSVNRTVNAEIVSAGTYFILNMKEWLSSFGLDLPTKDSPYVTEIAMGIKAESLKKGVPVNSVLANRKKGTSDVKVKAQADIVFVVDTTESMAAYIKKLKKNISAFAAELEAENILPSFALVDYRDIANDTSYPTRIIKNGNSNWYRSAKTFKKALFKLTASGGGDEPDTAIDGLGMARKLDFRKSARKFIILVTDTGYKLKNNYSIKSLSGLAKSFQEKEINISVFSKKGYKAEYKALYNKTGGIFANVDGNFKNNLLKIATKHTKNANNGYWVCLKGLTLKIARLDEKPVLGSTVDTDSDELNDVAELATIEPNVKLDINEYIQVLSKGKAPSYIFSYPSVYAYAYKSDPVLIDTDKDGIDDEEESVIGTYPKIADSDGDKLKDGIEAANWFEPLEQNPDGDTYSDYAEYKKGTDPFCYNRTRKENIEGFVEGVFLGDFIKNPSVPELCGQVTGSIIPVVGTVADVRDIVGNASAGDWGMAVLSAAGVVPVAGDFSKGASKVGKFITKNIDKADEIADLIITLSKNFPDDFAKLIPDSSLKKIVKIFRKDKNKFSRAQYQELARIMKKVGKKIPTVIDDFPNAKVIKASEDVWSYGPLKRGWKIDELCGNNLGRTYKTYDRYDKVTRMATSIKSIDTMCITYKNSSRLRTRLNRYAKQLLEGKSYVIMNGKRYDVAKRELELVLSDVPLTSAQKEVIDNFIEIYSDEINVSIIILK